LPLPGPIILLHMDYLQQSFSVTFDYRVYFTTALFDIANPLLENFFLDKKVEGEKRKIIVIADQQVADHHPNLLPQVTAYFGTYKTVQLVKDILLIPGGEIAKNNPEHFDRIVDAINDYGIDRHSYVAAIGGGSILDLAGYAAAVSHRGIKHIRIPTTVLSQNDSGVGVKNGVNYKNKKNFLGTFAPPVAVFNDYNFLITLSDRNWRSGISEAIKVSLIKDAAFFEWMEAHAAKLVARDKPSMEYLIKHCAKLHMEHIASGDPFESGSSRPLDFGHWSAHKLEQLTNFEVMHGEAVAMGIALDSIYSYLSGRLPEVAYQRILTLLKKLGFTLFHPMMSVEKADSPIILGLQEFQEHLGGQLTIMLLGSIGSGEEVHEMDYELLKEAGRKLQLA
jgi:3-dehydroquinate synthase